MTMMIFDNMNLERINIKINGTQYPTYEYQVNNEDLQRLYAAFLSCNYKKDLDEGTCVSYKDFCNLYLVVAFDVTKENDENLFSKTKSSELEVNWTLKDYQNVNYYTGCPRTGFPEKKGSLRANILTCILKKKSPISNDNREKTF
jgi:hypothetical protein